MELRIKKATYIIQRNFPWIDREDVEEIVKEIESCQDNKLSTQDIIDIVYDICKDV